MQLTKQCTWISLNLTMISNQARRWVERVFSSSMYALSNQMCIRESPKAGHLLFISPLNKRVVGSFHWATVGVTELTTANHRTLQPCVRCVDSCHASTIWISRIDLQWSPVDHRMRPSEHRMRPVLTGHVHREVCKTLKHRTLSTRLTPVRPVLCQKASKSSMLTPTSTGRSNGRPSASGAERPVRSGCSGQTLTIHRTLKACVDASMHCVRWVFLTRKHSCDFSKFPTDAIENMHFIFSKAPNPERNPNPSLP